MQHANDPKLPIATQSRMPEHFSTEPDLSHQWITSMQPHWKGLVQVSDEATRNLQTVLFNIEADVEMRRRAFKHLQKNAAQGNQDATNVLAQWSQILRTEDSATE